MNGQTIITIVPKAASEKDRRSQIGRFLEVLRLQHAAETANSQMSTDKTTCTTRATRKKSMNGISPCTTGVRAKTSHMEKTPAARSDRRPRISQAVASRPAAGLRIGRSKFALVIAYACWDLRGANYRHGDGAVNQDATTGQLAGDFRSATPTIHANKDNAPTNALVRIYGVTPRQIATVPSRI